MTPRDTARLFRVHPRLVAAITAILGQLPMFVVMGCRTTAQQQALYAQGRTAPGHIVTDKDGVIHLSNHQAHADGWGYAVDCAFIATAALPDPFDKRFPWNSYGTAVEAAGLVWGGRWVSPHDCPHAELRLVA